MPLTEDGLGTLLGNKIFVRMYHVAAGALVGCLCKAIYTKRIACHHIPTQLLRTDSSAGEIWDKT